MKNDLLALPDFLAHHLHADPLFCLANTVVWLDPLWLADDDGEVFGTALLTVRQVFPALYAQAIEMLRDQQSISTIGNMICAELNRIGLPVDDLEYLAFGIPLPAYGVDLTELGFYDEHPELLPLLALFGIAPDTLIPEQAYPIGQALGDALCNHPDSRYQQVGWLLLWLFAWTGNSIMDLTYEFMVEYEMLSWTPDEVAFALDMIRQADELMAQVTAGQALLLNQPALMNTLAQNIRQMEVVLKKGQKHDTVRLEWPPLADGLTGTTEPNA
ncbi:MAG: hypothetical protein F9K46_00390 [Anaerolineae bacterium]|nr:MAG: hypothetical protein F9K46_00390 [Anaerolineae bacterium]